MTQNHHQQGLLARLGCRISSWVSDIAAHPYAQIGFILVCAAWFAIGFATDLLTAVLSIMAITLTQMVLNRQNEREMDAHRRDVAMHAKIDELVIAMKGARNEMAGIEELEEDEIAELKEDVIEAIHKAGAADDPDKEQAVRDAATKAVDREVREARENPAPPRKRA